MPQFLIRLIAPRPTFVEDMTKEEEALMGIHFQYWKALCDKGTAIVVGPVFDTQLGPWGLSIVEAESETDARELAANDPAVVQKMMTFVIAPMRAALIRKSS